MTPLAAAGFRAIPNAVGKSSRFAVRFLTAPEHPGESMSEGPILVRVTRRWVFLALAAITLGSVALVAVLAFNTLHRVSELQTTTLIDQNKAMIALMDRFDLTLTHIMDHTAELDDRVTRLERAERIRKEQGK